MTRLEFERLRDLPNKFVDETIVWLPERGMGPNLVFKDVQVLNSLGLPIVLNGTYNPKVISITYNFVLRGIGPICRVDVNGKNHGNVGRTHKHSLMMPEDPALNIPHAEMRLDLVGKTALEVWTDLCARARIQHRSTFTNPE